MGADQYERVFVQSLVPHVRGDGKNELRHLAVGSFLSFISRAASRTVVIIKRSLSPGFAGIPNPLLAAENSFMLFGDGQQAVLDIIAALKEL